MTQRRLVVVTGGSRGIGAAVCRKLAALGDAVAVNYAGNADAAQEVVAATATAADGRTPSPPTWRTNIRSPRCSRRRSGSWAR